MANIITLERIGKFIVWFWNKYIKKTYIAYIDLEFHYSNVLFIAIGSIVAIVVLGIAVAYVTIKR